MKKRIFSLFLTMAMVLTLLPTMAFAANGMKTVYTNKNYKGGGSDGTEEKPFLNFEDALAAVQDGGTIIIDGTGYANDTTGLNSAVIFDKEVTLEGREKDGKKAELQLRAAGLILGADVHLKNVNLAMENIAYQTIFVNGHTLTAENVQGVQSANKGQIYIFAGMLDGASAKAGNDANINLTDCAVSNIYAGGMGQNFGGGVDITLNGNCTVGGIYGGGTESINAPSAANSATGAVNVTLNQFPSNLVIDGEGAGSFNVEATTTYPTTMTLKNVGQLNVTSGTVQLTDHTTTMDVILDSGARLDFSTSSATKEIHSLSAGTGSGTIIVGKNDTLTIGTVSGTHAFETTDGNLAQGTSGIVTEGHTYIIQNGGSGDFTFKPHFTQPNTKLVSEKTSSGTEWKTTTSSVTPGNPGTVTSLTIDKDSKNISKTVTEINNGSAEIKVNFTSSAADAALADVPLVFAFGDIQKNCGSGNDAVFDTLHMVLSVRDAEDGAAYIDVAKLGNSDIAAGTYSFTVSAPKDGGGNERVSDTFTLTVTDGNTQPPAAKTLTGLRITKQPDKTTYTEGETFDPAGMEVTADYSDTSTKVLNAGEYTVTPNAALTQSDEKVTISYTEGDITQTATVSITVNSKEQTPATITTAPTAKSNLVYNGTEQELVSAGTATGGTLQYKLDGGSYSTDLPKAKDAKTYTVYYKAVGNADLADVAENSIKVSIAKKDVTVAPKSVTIRRGNAIPAFELAYSGLVSGEKLKPSVAPNFVCNDKAGNPVSTSTAAGTYTITWANADDTTFNGADNYNVVKSATGTLTIRTSSSGGSSSSSSSQTTKPTPNKTETTKNTDGSTTKTETKADGTLVKTTTEVNGTTTVIETKKDGTVTETTTTPDGSSVTTKTEPDGSTTTERRDENGSVGTETTDANGKTEIRTTLSENAVSNAKETASPVAAPISVQAEKNSISAPQIHITLPQDAEKTKVEISVSNVTSGTVAILVHEDGTEEILKTSLPTQNGLLIEATGNMTIKIVDNSKDFADTRNHWSREDVNFIASRNLFAGIGNGNFGTKEPMTRGMVNTVLARLNGIETEGGSLWYKNGNDWAQRNGISDGTNPTAAVTREQLATMLYRNAGSPKVIGTLTFADAHSASAYAQNALIWAQQNGILSGVGNHCVAPKATAERAQVAAMLARYLQNAD